EAFQAVELLPHYCIEGKATTDTEIFGHRYAAPIGVAPMGSAGLMWPGAEKLFAAEAQRARIPYILATAGNASIGEIAAIAPDVFWFQLYRFPYANHAITFDLVRRADEAGAQVLVPTVDSAGKSKRPRDIRNGVRVPFPINPWTTYQVLTSPAWAMALIRNGMPITANLVPYAEKATQVATARDAAAIGRQSHLGGAQAPARPLEARVRGQGHPASAGRRARGGARCRRHHRLQSWWA